MPLQHDLVNQIQTGSTKENGTAAVTAPTTATPVKHPPPTTTTTTTTTTTAVEAPSTLLDDHSISNSSVAGSSNGEEEEADTQAEAETETEATGANAANNATGSSLSLQIRKTDHKRAEEAGWHKEEPLLKENPHRFVLFPIQDNEVSTVQNKPSERRDTHRLTLSKVPR
jgi:hypothetical protein